jgi:hypothetical protein
MTTDSFTQPVTGQKFFYGITLILSAILFFWFLNIHQLNTESTLRARQLWGSSYQLLAIVGGIIGVRVAKAWGFKSLIGKAILFFALGLFLQSFGQSVDSYYNFFHNATIPYPSLGDVGFMGSVFAYIVAATYLLKATGIKVSFQSTKGKILAISIPLLILIVCYLFFLQGYQFDWDNKLKILLDFGYPLGQAIYVSIVAVAYVTSKNYFRGTLRLPVVFLIVALVFQYISDFTFLYQANAGTWYVGGLNDLMYFISYALMAFALIYISSVHKAIFENRN